jgi:hypothetical protein
MKTVKDVLLSGVRLEMDDNYPKLNYLSSNLTAILQQRSSEPSTNPIAALAAGNLFYFSNFRLYGENGERLIYRLI